ncbi:hypothetical protein LSAT2_024610, partial [Lamellibrachia satsuma]
HAGTYIYRCNEEFGILTIPSYLGHPRVGRWVSDRGVQRHIGRRVSARAVQRHVPVSSIRDMRRSSVVSSVRHSSRGFNPALADVRISVGVVHVELLWTHALCSPFRNELHGARFRGVPVVGEVVVAIRFTDRGPRTAAEA